MLLNLTHAKTVKNLVRDVFPLPLDVLFALKISISSKILHALLVSQIVKIAKTQQLAWFAMTAIISMGKSVLSAQKHSKAANCACILQYVCIVTLKITGS